jgi:hypothetical protein
VAYLPIHTNNAMSRTLQKLYEINNLLLIEEVEDAQALVMSLIEELETDFSGLGFDEEIDYN